MKKIALMVAIAALTLPAVANAQSWSNVAIDEGGKGRWSYDLETYNASGSVARFVARHEENTGHWQVMYMEVNCRSLAFRIGPMRSYSGRTLLVSSSTYDNWRYIGTGSIAAFYLEEVCEF